MIIKGKITLKETAPSLEEYGELTIPINIDLSISKTQQLASVEYGNIEYGSFIKFFNDQLNYEIAVIVEEFFSKTYQENLIRIDSEKQEPYYQESLIENMGVV